MPATLRVDKMLADRMTADTVRFALTRPPMMVFWVVVTLGIAGFVVLLVLAPEEAVGMWWFALALVVLVVALVSLVVVPVRRAVRTGLPVGSDVAASVVDDLLKIEAAQGSSQIRVAALTRVHLLRETVVLQMRGSGSASILPRRLLDDHELALIGAR